MLTEAEIKRKLYGEYETVSGGTHSSAHEVKMSGPAFESQAVKKNTLDARVNVASAAIGVGAGVRPATVARPSTASVPFSDRVQSSSPKKNWQQTLKTSGRVVLGFLAGILWKAGSYLVKILDFILRILDPRKPQARRLLYSITACVMVAALFMGVFRLNNQRKKAMLGELPAVAKVVVSPVSAPSVSADPEQPVVSESTQAVELTQREESQEMILKALENSAGVAAGTSLTPALGNGSVASVSAPAGKYVIQVATYAVLEDASRIIQNLNQAGFESFYKKQIRNSTGHSFFTVCLGRFESYTNAQEALAKFRKAAVARPFQDAFIRTMEP
ncbi:MAG TPA: SPOR domain-containing protein [Candidatus Omnitrophota bacterium]|nr:SPOR domain-containing protein [Candidatus Omnitrophota bacterium]